MPCDNVRWFPGKITSKNTMSPSIYEVVDVLTDYALQVKKVGTDDNLLAVTSDCMIAIDQLAWASLEAIM